MATIEKKNKGICSSFCVCAQAVIGNEQTKKLVDFIYEKMGTPKLPDEYGGFLSPVAIYKARFEKYSIVVTLEIFYSKDAIKKLVDEISSSKEASQKLKEGLMRFKEEIPLQAANFGSYADTNHASLRIFIEALSFHKGAHLSMDVIENIPKQKNEISNVIKMAGKTFKMPAKLTTCATFRFDSSKSKLIGGLVLPTQLPLSLEIGSKIGNAQLHSLTIKLIDSKIGLEEIEVSQEKEYLEIKTRGTFQLNEFDRFIAKPFELSSEYSDLLVEGI